MKRPRILRFCRWLSPRFAMLVDMLAELNAMTDSDFDEWLGEL